MEKSIFFTLKELGFEEEPHLQHLKVTLSRVDHIDYATDKDLRYCIDDKDQLIGLHISGYTFEPKGWDKLENIIERASSLEVLYLTGTLLKKLELESHPSIRFINVSGNEELRSIQLKNLENLEFFDASLCKGLTAVALHENLPTLAKVDVSNGQINNLVLNADLPKIEYFNFSQNAVETLNLTSFENIACILGKGNSISEIKWPKGFQKNLYLFEIDTASLLDEALGAVLNKTNEELLEALNAYLGAMNPSGSKKAKEEKRILKLILIGNTTIGKSTLKRVLLASDGDEKDQAQNSGPSTHGVQIFNFERKNDDKVTHIQGFDFGGQDYYHATHLPFFQPNALNLLVFGRGKDTDKIKGHTNAYEYGEKEVEGIPETLFPIDYWLGSLQKNKKKQDHGQVNKSLEDSHFTDIPAEKKIPKAKVVIVQNLFENSDFHDLNHFGLKQRPDVEIVGKVSTYNFHDDATTLKNEVNGLIDKNAQKSEIVEADKEIKEAFDKLANKERRIIFDTKEIEGLGFLKKKFKSDKSKIKYALERLYFRQMGYFLDYQGNSKSEEEDYLFISNIEIASQWIHAILSKEVRVTGEGYISEISTKKLLENSASKVGNDDKPKWDEIKPNFMKLIRFLEHENVLFRFGEGEEKWVAPSYLPPLSSIKDKLFLQLFDTPDVVVEFNEYFHSNIIQLIISKFKGDLIKDQGKKQFLLWKNKVLIAQHKDNEQSAMLLLELFYPHDEGYEDGFPPSRERPKGFLTSDKDRKMPILKVRRNQAALVSDSYFHKVFQFLEGELDGISKKQIWVKSRIGNYVPFDLINRVCRTDGNKKISLLYFDDVLYAKHDFKRFMGQSDKTPTKVFIAYSRQDLEYVEELLLHLRPYKKEGEIELFYDREMQMGDKWDEVLKHQLTLSDVVLCMVSPNMLNTNYVTDLELPLAEEMNIPIVPIIVDECKWLNLSLGRDTFNYLGDNQAEGKGIPLPENRKERQKKLMWIAEEVSKFAVKKT